MELEKLADVPISGGTGTTRKKDGGYISSQVTKFRIPKKFVDKLGIPRHDKDGIPIRIPLFISPSLSKAAETGEFYLLFKFNMNELDIGEQVPSEEVPKDNNIKEETPIVETEEESSKNNNTEIKADTKVTSSDFDISNIINEGEEIQK